MLPHHDHRTLGSRLDLFHFQEEAPGSAFWHPRGMTLFRLLEARIRAHIEAEGYAEVRTPQVLGESLWRRSGHWDHFRANLFVLEEEGLALKPVSCPGHIELARRLAPSYRALPLRLAEFGLCHRKEPSGALHGLFRLYQFTQDDGHIFCAEEQVEEEVARFARGLFAFYRGLGLGEVRTGLSLRPESRAGTDDLWDRAEAALASAAALAGLDCALQPGEGAFYGPKLEFTLPDAQGRPWTCGTIQLDLVLPGRFGLDYAAADGGRRSMVMLHRALVGSLERMIGFLLEHHGGRLPPGLAPEQAVVAPLSEAQEDPARELCARLSAAGLRARLDGRREPLSKKAFEARELGVPWFIALGPREAAGGPLSLRTPDGKLLQLAPEAALARMMAEARNG